MSHMMGEVEPLVSHSYIVQVRKCVCSYYTVCQLYSVATVSSPPPLEYRNICGQLKELYNCCISTKVDNIWNSISFCAYCGGVKIWCHHFVTEGCAEVGFKLLGASLSSPILCILATINIAISCPTQQSTITYIPFFHMPLDYGIASASNKLLPQDNISAYPLGHS